MDARAIAGLAVRIDRAAVPHGLQRVDRGGDHAARRLAIGRCDQAHAAGVAFKFWAVHAFPRDAEAFGIDMFHILTFHDAAAIAAFIRASTFGWTCCMNKPISLASAGRRIAERALSLRPVADDR